MEPQDADFGKSNSGCRWARFGGTVPLALKVISFYGYGIDQLARFLERWHATVIWKQIGGRQQAWPTAAAIEWRPVAGSTCLTIIGCSDSPAPPVEAEANCYAANQDLDMAV
jgi:hypothetical protein